MKKNASAKKMPSADSGIVSLWPRLDVIVATLVIPFFVLYWLVPFISKQTIGNDYLRYWIEQQLYLRFSIRNGTFPLYAPGFLGGWTASAMTLGQLWHPISWVAAHLPGYWSGYAHETGTLLRLLSLGATHLVLLMFLRRLRLTMVMAFLISFIAIYNLRMLDMFRYGTSLESYVAYLLLCVALAWHYIAPTKRLGPVCIAVSTWLLIVAGHPQMMYIGMLGAVLICLVAPFYMAHLLPDEPPLERRRLWMYYLSAGLSVTAGILLASSYILPFCFEYLTETFRSIGLSFRWASDYKDTLGGLICNFSTPFRSDVHGAFGGSALFLLALLTPLILLLRIRIPLPVFCLWLALIVTCVLTLGSNGPLYYYFWKYFPLTQQFRVPGRLSLVLPFIMLLLLVWMARLKSLHFRIRGRVLSVSPLALLAIIALVLFIILNCFPPEVSESQGLRLRYSPEKLNNIPTVIVVLTTAFGLVSLAAMGFYGTSPRFRTITGIVLIAAVFLQARVTLRYGTWVAPKPGKISTFEEIQAQQRKEVVFRCSPAKGSKFVIQHLQRTFLEPTLAHVCRKHTVVDSREEAYEYMARERSIDHIFVEDYPGAKTEAPVLPSGDTGLDSVELKYNSFNNMRFNVMCSRSAFFVFSLPYSHRWRAYVNEERLPVYRSNGIEQSVKLPAGNSVVEFRYWSWPALVGAGLSCLTLLLVSFGLLVAVRSRLIRYSAMIATACACVLALLSWYHSLYGGGNIGTNYTWTSEAIGPNLSSRHNLAYGKVTAMSQRGGVSSCFQASPRGVDGQRVPKPGFVTDLMERAWWQVDLGRAQPIAEIVIYKPRGRYSEDYLNGGLPFDVIVSPDGKRAFLVKTVTQKGVADHWRIRLQDVTARYIRLQTRHRGRLALAEVEVYGPEDIGTGNRIE